MPGLVSGRPYVGRFAPSPTGLLHSGSLVAALASWLDAKAHGGQWLVRVEDVDSPRCQPGAAQAIVQQLVACGLVPDGPVWFQSERGAAYQQALNGLMERQLAYPCTCTRKDIATAHAASGQVRARHAELRYPGTCRPTNPPGSTASTQIQPPHAWRLRTDQYSKLFWPPSSDSTSDSAPFFDTPSHHCHWFDRLAGWQQQDIEATVGDFVLQRADGVWAYQLAVVVDDAAQGITHVVRGQDLADNTPRQVLLQHALGLPHPQYLHTPLVLGTNGEKLSKQNGAAALDLSTPQHVLAALNAAAAALKLPAQTAPASESLHHWVGAWVGALASGLDNPPHARNASNDSPSRTPPPDFP